MARRAEDSPPYPDVVGMNSSLQPGPNPCIMMANNDQKCKITRMKCCLFHPGELTGTIRTLCILALLAWPGLGRVAAITDVYLLNVPDYSWQYGCFGSATGNLFGFWDRNGFPNYYTGPTAGGVAPLNNYSGNATIRAMWASQQGFDGRPSDKPGHVDDYWFEYASRESTTNDPCVLAGRAEHAPDCIGDFIGLNQKKWTNSLMNGECNGNIDGYCFVYWDATGDKRVNFTPPATAGTPPRDVQSGLRAWSQYRGYDADVFTQLVDFNPNTPPLMGFTAEELKSEINSGYPVLILLQAYGTYYRSMGAMPRANPEIHGMLVYGYQEDAFGVIARIRTSWASGDGVVIPWDGTPFTANLSIRGVIGFHPKPKITKITRGPTKISITWDGPLVQLRDVINGTTNDLHQYVVEKSPTLNPADFQPVTDPSPRLSAMILDNSTQTSFYRVRLVETP
jgi:hypothetical protein